MYIHDLINPRTGLTYKEENEVKAHNIPIGALVEDTYTGVRLFVVFRNRDCDGTPLYCLCHDKEDTKVEREGFANHKWWCGHPEDCHKS
jgi:hypothetical protein